MAVGSTKNIGNACENMWEKHVETTTVLMCAVWALLIIISSSNVHVCVYSLFYFTTVWFGNGVRRKVLLLATHDPA
jgi:hypothetical protein